MDDPAVHAEALAFLRESGSDLFLVLSREGTILDANRSARSVTGRPLVGEPFRKMIIDFTGGFDITAAADGTAGNQWVSIGGPGGVPRSFQFSFKPLGDRILAFGRLDADELETLHREVVALNGELNNLTRELHRKNAQLGRLNEEKNRFLGMAAHDLRKPIGLVLSYCEFLMDEAGHLLDPERNGFLRTIQTSAESMKRLVDDFLDVSAIEAGKFDLDLRPAAIGEVLERSLELNRRQAAANGVELRVRRDGGPERMVMDPFKVEQVITNLVGNAVEHSRPGGTVVITLSGDDGALLFSVRDQGPGIAPAEMGQLFKPFGRTSAKKVSGAKSTGLGLLITRKIIEAHGGEIRAESRPGKGTTITFKLPVERTKP